MYSKFSQVMRLPYGNHKNNFEQHQIGQSSKQFKLKVHHHVNLDKEFKADCQLWIHFLELDNYKILNRPMVDLIENPIGHAKELGFYSDASVQLDLGFGAILGKKWICGTWEQNFVKNYNPSIEYLELFALCAGHHDMATGAERCIIYLFTVITKRLWP